MYSFVQKKKKEIFLKKKFENDEKHIFSKMFNFPSQKEHKQTRWWMVIDSMLAITVRW